MDTLDKKVNEHYGGKVVRKDLTKLVKGNAVVPTYVLEYLLGQYCATDDEETINAGVESVKKIIAEHFVHRDEAQYIKSVIKEKGSHRIIDKVSVKLNDRRGLYEAAFANLGVKKVIVDPDIVKRHKKLLSSGVWCIVTLGYIVPEEKEQSPWILESIKPIQVAQIDIEEFKEARKLFKTDEWLDLLMRSIGLNPEHFNKRSKFIQLTRLVPFAENNYNLIELGPKGTGKSHIYSEMSPHGILISGGEVTKAKLFVNNSTGDIGLVGYWDVVAYDEFAGTTKKVDKGLVDIMKNYMANKSFSRGTEVYGADASMAFVGNTLHSVAFMLKHSDLFEALPDVYHDSAFLDRIQCYLPGWEVNKLRTEMFTNNYGFIVDYLAEILKHLRKEDYTNIYKEYFELSDTLTSRDRDSIAKTVSGLIKVIYPDGQYDENQLKELFDFAIENRKRVKQELIKMDETFEPVDFSYNINSSGKKVIINTLEYLNYLPEQIDKSEEDLVDTEEKEEPKNTKKKLPDYSQKIIHDNQTGISYYKLFADYLKGATEITLTDPFIRLPYQMRNFMEFCRLVADVKEKGEMVKLHLVTNNNEEYLENAKESFKQIQESLESMEIYFTYEFDDSIHDRFIETNNGWKIILGRGLDLFQKTDGPFDLAEIYQEKRLCRHTQITYLAK
ncbi:MAG: BREX system Lon protease-like protein BrxL [Bacteroidales bacterium]|nr:BREX system Lon protease-like protein BrxL [Bacteroidales bacterium]MCF8336415.1 BREX system Lon protease-like protein BrxL [Bacteroidales bacterium]